MPVVLVASVVLVVSAAVGSLVDPPPLLPGASVVDSALVLAAPVLAAPVVTTSVVEASTIVSVADDVSSGRPSLAQPSRPASAHQRRHEWFLRGPADTRALSHSRPGAATEPLKTAKFLVVQARDGYPRGVLGPVRLLTLLIGAGLIAATVLPRLVGLDAGLPLLLNEDEQFSAGFAQALAVDGDLRGVSWHYPPLLGELMAGACIGPCDEPTLVFVGRVLSVIAAVFAVLATAAAAHLAGVRRGLGCAAALLLGWSPTFTFMSRYATPDVLCTAFVALALLACVGIQTAGSRRWYVLAGLAIGLAAGAKYNAGLVCVAVAAAHLTTAQRWRRLPWLVLSAAISVAVFGLVLAGPWDGVDVVIEGLRYEWQHYAQGHGGFTTDRPLADALVHLAVFAFGGVAVIAAAIGAGRSAQRGDRARGLVVPAIVFVVAYLALIARGQMFVDRVLLPILPALALLVGLGLDRLVDAATRRGPRTTTLASLALAAAVLVQPLRATIGQVRALGPEDSRLAAHRWILANLDDPSLKILAVPRSARFVLKGLDPATVKIPPPEQVARRLPYSTHVVFARGSYNRYLRTPERFPEEAAKAEALIAELERVAVRVHRFENPPLPGAELFGATFALYHQVAVDVFELR